MLESLGLDRTTSSAYRIWLRDATLSTAEVAVRLGVTREEVEQAQRVLVERGLLLVSWEEPGRLVPVNPEVTVERMYQEQQLHLARKQQELLEARAELTDLVTDYTRGVGSRSTGDSHEHLQGIDRIRCTIEELSATAQEEILAMHPACEHTAEALAEALALDIKAIQRGMVLRCIYAESTQVDPVTVNYLHAAAAAGMQVRCARTVPMRMLVFDRTAGIIPLHVTDTGQSALIVRGEALVAVLVLSFEQLWVTSQPLQQLGRELEVGLASGGAIGLSESDRSLLRLLGMGVKDEAAARHLGVSVRTVRRQIADIMRTLEAESRFQAGIEAANRGWL